MLNYLRADLYRAWKTGSIATMVGVILGVLTLLVGMHALTHAGLLPDVTPVEDANTITGTFVSFTAGSLYSGNFLVLISFWCTVNLVASDFKNGTFKTTLATPRARLSYLGAKIAGGVVICAAFNALALAVAAVLPAIFGLGYSAVPAPADALGWWACSVLVCVGYTAVCVLLTVLAGNETLAWVLSLLTGWGIAGSALLQLIAVAGVLVPALAPLCSAAADALLVTWAAILSAGPGFLAHAGTVAHVALTPLAWTAAASALACLALRRKAL